MIIAIHISVAIMTGRRELTEEGGGWVGMNSEDENETKSLDNDQHKSAVIIPSITLITAMVVIAERRMIA